MVTWKGRGRGEERKDEEEEKERLSTRPEERGKESAMHCRE